MTTWEFQAVLAEEFIAFVDKDSDGNAVGIAAETSAMNLIVNGRRATEISKKSRRNCCVC